MRDWGVKGVKKWWGAIGWVLSSNQKYWYFDAPDLWEFCNGRISHEKLLQSLFICPFSLASFQSKEFSQGGNRVDWTYFCGQWQENSWETLLWMISSSAIFVIHTCARMSKLTDCQINISTVCITGTATHHVVYRETERQTFIRPYKLVYEMIFVWNEWLWSEGPC